MTPPHVEGRGLCKSYRHGVCALREVSLIVPTGSFTLLTGPSGSGKTTLLSLICALDRPTSGTVVFDGQDLTRYSDAALSRVRRRMGIVTQDFALIAGLPVWENVTYPLIPRGTRRVDRRRLAANVLERLGLGNRLDSKARELSGGEQQRVAIARALAGNPEILFADEPTSNLDDETSQNVVATLLEASNAGTTIVASSHDQRLVGHATQIVELRGGRLYRSSDELVQGAK